jgi:hypothetical protein
MTDKFEPIVAADRRLLFEFPECSDRGDLEIHHVHDLVALFKYAESGDEFWIRFDRTYAYRYLTQSMCTEFHVDQSIDQLVELTESQWSQEVLSEASNSADFRHFLFFAEDHGALEVLAADYDTGGRSPLPPEHQPDDDDE